MTSDRYEVVIVGGGINGVGVAQAAAAAGYKTLLLEKNDQLALETSRRSSKLIHGGLRYLETLQLGMVRESLLERALLLKLAPDLVKLQRFNIPVYPETSRSRLTLHAGLSLYALLSGLSNQGFYRVLHSKDWANLDGIKTARLKAVFQYQDAQTDDRMLTLAVMHSALNLGAEYRCNARVTAATIQRDHVSITYLQDSKQQQIDASVLINASGPWVNDLNKVIQPSTFMYPPELVQGSHLLIKQPVHQAYYLEAPQDHRAVFLLPYKGMSLLGTTEQIYTGDPGEVHALDTEKHYLLDVLEHYFPHHDKTVKRDMAGCRVLPADENNPNKRSRETIFHLDNRNNPRVLSVIGGKLTVYRKTAEKVMAMIKPSLAEKKPVADTTRLTLSAIDRL